MQQTLKRAASLLLALMLAFQLLPAPISAAPGGATSAADMNALEALGIDTTAAPKDYDPYSNSNPYGKNSVTVNPVSELFYWESRVDYKYKAPTIEYQASFGADTRFYSSLYGHETKAETFSQFMKNPINSSNMASYYFPSCAGNNAVIEALERNGLTPSNYLQDETFISYKENPNFQFSSMVAGNFTGDETGKKAQVAFLRSRYSSDDISVTGTRMELLFADPTNMRSLDLARTGIKLETETMGNSQDKFSDFSYQYQNYLQLESGDFDGDGYDEVAVYVPETTNPRIEVYKLTVASDSQPDDYKSFYKWYVAWSYPLKKAGGMVPNMVSLTSGDFNRDGVDDLAITYGHMYYGTTSGTLDYSSTAAAVLYGSREEMLKKSTSFPLKTGDGEDLVRVAFTYGSITGTDSNQLVLGGQVASDMASGNPSSRYVALYSFDGEEFSIQWEKNYNLFEKDKAGNLTYPVMSRNSEEFYSAPLVVSNLATIARGLNESAQLYFDSLIFEYTDSGLELVVPLDNTPQRQSSDSACRTYVEYGAKSADLVGYGYETMVTMQNVLPTEKILFQWPWAGFPNITMTLPEEYHRIIMAGAAKPSDAKTTRTQTSGNSAFCLPNTDNDTAYLKYTGEHYFVYSDPKVLAVVSAPPTFDDLLGRDDLSGNYAESMTSYGTSEGSGGGSTANVTIKAGAYVSIEHSITVFGVEVAKIESETVITGAFTYDFEKVSTLTQSVEYSTSAGSDIVAFYSIPLEVYGYTAYTPNGNGGYDETYMTVSKPHQASVRVLELEDYERIAADYAELPQISGNILTHTVGDPSTYPRQATGKDVTAYKGDWAAVGFSGQAGGSGITQRIEIGTDTSHTYSGSGAIETKIGAGAGGIVAGVVLGVEAGGGTVTTSSAGSSFSGTLQNMPAEAKPYGYGYSWKIFCRSQEVDGCVFPVVEYMVADVSMPAPLPTDFAQSSAGTTAGEVELTWTYDRMVAGFQLYRYYDFPDGAGSYEIAFVPMNDGVRQADGTYAFSYTDKNLDPYTEYKYQIQTVRPYVPNNSIPCQILSARTKAAQGYPDITLMGVEDDGTTLYVYPDATSSVVAVVNNASDYPQGIAYQWQMLTEKGWVDLSGQETNTLTFKSAGQADQALYRCRTNVSYSSQYISAYSDPVQVVYNKRTPALACDIAADAGPDGVPFATVELISKDPRHNALPSGDVTFTISGQGYEKAYTVALDTTGSTAVAKLPATATALGAGAYSLEVYYKGSRVFKSFTPDPVTLLVGDVGYAVEVSTSPTFDTLVKEAPYGDRLYARLAQFTRNEAGDVVRSILDPATDKVLVANPETGEQEEQAFHLGLSYGGKSYDFATADRDVWSTVIGRSTIYARTGEYAPFAAGASYLGVTAVNINKRDIQLSIDSKTVTYGSVKDNVPQAQSTDAGWLLQPVLGVRGYDTAGKAITFSDALLPGNYALVPYMNTASFSFFNVTAVEAGTLTVTGPRYSLSINVPKVNNNIPGTVQLIAPQDGEIFTNGFSAGTGLFFLAQPYEGYEVDRWILTPGTAAPIIQQGGNTFSHITKAEDVSLEVIFKLAEHTLTVSSNPTQGGTVALPEYFVNGAGVVEGADLQFTAVPNEGYTFAGWDFITGGSALSQMDGTANPDGTNTVTINMPPVSTRLIARFTRNSYAVRLDDGVKASYQVVTPDGETQTITFTGAQIVPGDTLITFAAADGRTLVDGAQWIIDGQPTGDTGAEYTVTLVGDITASIQTSALTFTLKLGQVTGGAVTAAIGGSPVQIPDEGIVLSSDTPVTFTVQPAYSYLLEEWQVTTQAGTAAVGQGLHTFVLTHMEADTTVNAVFTRKQYCPITLTPDATGAITYTVFDPWGTPQASGLAAGGRETVVDAYQGDTVQLTAAPNLQSYMVNRWTLDGQDVGRAASQLLEEINQAHSASVSFMAKINYTVTYSADNDSDITGFAATADGTPFTSGNSIGAGSQIVIQPTLATGKVIDYWQINGQIYTHKMNTYFAELSIDGLVGNLDIVAFTRDKGTAQITGNGDAVFSGTGTYDLGDVVTVEVAAAEGFDLDDVQLVRGQDTFEDDQVFLTKEYTDQGITCTFYAFDDLTVQALTTGKQYPIVVAPAANGTVSAPQSAPAGQDVTVTATPDSGYRLADIWVVSLPSESTVLGVYDNGQFTFEMPVGTAVVIAAFQPIPPARSYSIQVPVNGMLTADGGTGGVCLEGDSLYIEATPDQGYALTSLTANGVEILNNASYTVKEDTVFAARFTALEDIDPAANTYSITVGAATGQGAIAVTGAGQYITGYQPTPIAGRALPALDADAWPEYLPISITATPAQGWRLASLTVNGQGVSSGYTTTLTEDITITAVFEPVPPQPTFSITKNVTGQGTVYIVETTVALGGDARAVVIPAPGNEIFDVAVNGVSQGVQDAVLVTNVTQDIEISATFVKDGGIYTVTASAGSGGRITPSGTMRKIEGDTVTFSISPSSGYRVSNVTLDGISLGAVSTYTLTVAGNHTISASFTSTGNNNPRPNPGPGPSGGDEEEIDDKDALAGLIDFEAFINGYTDKTFRGGLAVTREQFVKMLYGLKADEAALFEAPATATFADVAAPNAQGDAGRWSYVPVEWAYAQGLITADLQGKFNPEAPMLRGEMAHILAKLEGLSEKAENIFTDIDGHMYQDAILMVLNAGIIVGYPDGTYRPDGSITRNETVVALVRYMLGGEDPTPQQTEGLTIDLTDVSPADEWCYRHIVLAVNGYSDPEDSKQEENKDK